MGKKQFYLVIDTETTQAGTVADFGAVVVDRHGKVFNQCAVLIKGEFGEKELFYSPCEHDPRAFWSKQGARIRERNYTDMLNRGTRVLASTSAINSWLAKCLGQYPDIELTAYNLAFDLQKCAATDIMLDSFVNRFCLWEASVGNICSTRKYKHFALQHHLFNAPTEKGNCTVKTSAEAVYSFIQQQPMLEPHTAIEDCFIEACSILPVIVRKKKWRDNVKPYNWRSLQLRDHFKVL